MSSLKNKLKKGQPIIGTMLVLMDNPDIVKLLKVCEFDYFIVDCEHSTYDFKDVAGLLGMAKAIGLLKLLAQGEQDLEQNRLTSQEEVFAEMDFYFKGHSKNGG